MMSGISSTHIPIDVSNTRLSIEESERSSEKKGENVYMQTDRYAEEYEEMSQLGCGGFGTVFKAVHKFNGNAYAIKKIPIRDGDDCLKLFKELKILANLNSDYVVKYYSAWMESNDNHKISVSDSSEVKTIERSLTESNDDDLQSVHVKSLLFIQMELCSSTLKDTMDLLNAELNQHKSTFLTSIGYYIASELFIEILESIDYLHKMDKPVIHRDLKPANILITDGSNGRFIKIADFGLATLHEIDKITHTQGVGTLKYMAPEVLNCRKYNTKADIYSLGVIMKELFNLNINCSSDLSNKSAELDNIELDVQRTKYLSANVIYHNMVSTSPSVRPYCEQILLNKSLWALNFGELLTDKTLSDFVQNIRDECRSVERSDIFHVNFIKQRCSQKVYVQTGRYNKEFEEMSQLGCGGFGTVCKAVHKFNGNAYAIKKIPIQDGDDYVKLFKELKILSNLNSDYVVKYYSAWIESDNNSKSITNRSRKLKKFETSLTKSVDNNFHSHNKTGFLYIQMELCSATLSDTMDLLNAELNQHKSTFLTSIGYYIVSELFIEILESIDYLHKMDKPVIHRDLKPANILITDGSNGRFVKIADFGLSTLHEIDKQTHTQGMGTQEYTAPEVWIGRTYNTKADIYSLGVIMKVLFNLDINDSIDISNIKTESDIQFKVERTKYMSAGVVYHNMTSTSTSLRPSCEQILENKSLWALSLDELLTDKTLIGFEQKMRDECKSDECSDKFYLNFMKQRFTRRVKLTAPTINESNHLLKNNNSFGLVDVSNYMIETFTKIRDEVCSRLDPLVLHESVNEQFQSDIFGHNVTLKIESGAKIMGASGVTITKFKATIDLNEFKLEVIADFTLNELRSSGKYELSGNVFRYFPISGNGSVFVDLKIISGQLRVTGHFNSDYLMNTESFDLKMSFSSVSLYFDNLVDSAFSPYLSSLINFLAKPIVDLMILKNQTTMEKVNRKLKHVIDGEIKSLNVQNILRHIQKYEQN